VHRHLQYFSGNLLVDVGHLLVRSELQNVLDGVVALLVFRECDDVGNDLFDDRGHDALRTVLQHALHDPTALGMHRHLLGPAAERVDHQVYVLVVLSDKLYDLLDDMISVLVFHTPNDVV
jgi:hypothetical protein